MRQGENTILAEAISASRPLIQRCERPSIRKGSSDRSAPLLGTQESIESANHEIHLCQGDSLR
jgi:hypothetical protein